MSRDDVLRRLSEERFDVAVIGGGIVGCGVALDAAARGLKVALLERRDLGSGTSSKSSRQVHGGIRYLAHGELGLVRESLAERRLLAWSAPHLVRPLPMLLPLRRHRLQLRAAATAYDLLGAWRYEGRHHREGDTLRYAEGRVDDARLTVTVARTAIAHGAVVATDCPVTAIDGDVVRCGEVVIRARTVVNAAGVWADEVRELAEPGAPAQLRPARGTHVVLPAERLPRDVGLVLPVGGARFVFTIPWGRVTIAGTTDVDHDGPLDDPQPTEPEIEEILASLNTYVEEPVARGDVVAAYAGLRPLVAGAGARTADLSRRHSVTVSGNVVTIAGGKLTTYRRIAAAAVDRLADAGLGAVPPSTTRRLRLHGALDAARTPLELRHGTDAVAVEELARREGLGEPLHDELPYLEAEVVWAARRELARTVDDVLARRTRIATELPDGGRALVPRIEELLARA